MYVDSENVIFVYIFTYMCIKNLNIMCTIRVYVCELPASEVFRRYGFYRLYVVMHSQYIEIYTGYIHGNNYTFCMDRCIYTCDAYTHDCVVESLLCSTKHTFLSVYLEIKRERFNVQVDKCNEYGFTETITNAKLNRCIIATMMKTFSLPSRTKIMGNRKVTEDYHSKIIHW